MGSGPGTRGRIVASRDRTLALAAIVTDDIDETNPPEAEVISPEPGSLEDAVRVAGEFGFRITAFDAKDWARHFGERSRALALYQPGGKEIFINASRLSDSAETRKLIQRLHRTGWFASSHPSGIVHHELGHGLHWRNVSRGIFGLVRGLSRFARLRNKVMPRVLARHISKEVSQYAASSRLEIVAEMYAGMRSGKKYSSRLMKYYKLLGGEIPTGH